MSSAAPQICARCLLPRSIPYLSFDEQVDVEPFRTGIAATTAEDTPELDHDLTL